MIEHRTHGATGYAARTTRDDGAWTDLHLAATPTGTDTWTPAVDDPSPRCAAVTPWDDRVARRVLSTVAITPAGALPVGRLALLFNDHVTLYHVAGSATEDLYANGDGDELACVIDGAGALVCPYGRLTVGAGEYVWIPRGMPHAWQFQGDARMLLLACQGELRVPPRWRNALGQLGSHAPYGHRDFRAPVWSWGTQGQPRSVDGRWRVFHRREGDLYETYTTVHPLAAVGWEGAVYPVALPWECAMVRGMAGATLFEHAGFTVESTIVRATAGSGGAGQDTVSLVVDGDGNAPVCWTPGCAPAGLHGAEGALAVVVRTRQPLRLTATGAALALR